MPWHHGNPTAPDIVTHMYESIEFVCLANKSVDGKSESIASDPLFADSETSNFLEYECVGSKTKISESSTRIDGRMDSGFKVSNFQFEYGLKV